MKPIVSRSVLLAIWLSQVTPLSAQVPEEAVRVVDVNGQPTRVLTLGLEERRPGQPVLFLQGGQGSAIESWGNWVVSVSELAPVVAYDRVGIGGSPFDGIEPTMERVVAHAHDLLEVLEVHPPYVLVGHSWGGPLILYFAGRYPEEVTGMVYLDPTPLRLTRQEYWGASTEAELDRRREEWERVVTASFANPGHVAEDRFIIRFMTTPLEERGTPPDPRVPTALVDGTRPPPSGGSSSLSFNLGAAYRALNLERIPKWIRGLPNGTLLLASDVGHFVHAEDPELATEAVRRVLEARIIVDLDRAVLGRYAGTYETESGELQTVTLDPAGLMVQRPEGRKRLLLALSPTEFFVANFNARVTFILEEGNVVGMVWNERGKVEYTKIR